MKIYCKIILVFVFCIFTKTSNSQEKRDVLGVLGAGPTSFDFSTYLNGLKNVPPIGPGYKIRDIFSLLLYNYDNSLPVNAQKLNTTIDYPGQNNNNILGLGHDVGGLAIRGCANPKITGLILINVPNNGSGLMQSFFYPNLHQKSPSIWLDDIAGIADYEDCGYCNKMKNIREFVESIMASEPMLKPASNVPNEYVQSITKPNTQNTAVIWSNAKGLTLNDLIGRNNGLGQIDLQACAEDQIASSFGRLAHDFLMNAINSIAGINDISISERINRINKADINTRKNIMCRLSDKKLESDWRLRIVQDKVTFISKLSPFSCESLDEETYKLLVSYFLSPENAEALFMAYCKPSFNFSVIEPTSLVYSKSEQTLGNEYVTKEFYGTHFDPIFIENYPFLIDFFEGKYGDAYKLPK